VTIEKGELVTSVKKKKGKQNLSIGRCWEWQTTSLIALSLVCWLRLARRLYVYNAGLKVDISQEILTVARRHIMKTFAHVKDTQ